MTTPPRRAELRFRHIVENIDLIVEFTDRMGFVQFTKDARTRMAVERGLLIISEAANRLGPQAEQRCPEIPWHRLRGLGDRLERMNPGTIWGTITEDLAVLRAACQRQLER